MSADIRWSLEAQLRFTTLAAATRKRIEETLVRARAQAVRDQWVRSVATVDGHRVSYLLTTTETGVREVFVEAISTDTDP